MSKKLLLADDSITIQKVIQITFAHEDYELTITDNGDAALAKAQEIKPDLIMTDIYMPGKNGYELTAAIKQDPALRHVPVLLLAGSFEPFDEDKARSCKADAWIEKPFESQSLIDKVAELLSAARSAPDASVPVAEPEPSVAFEQSPSVAFDAPESFQPEMAAATEDPFADISFEEESFAMEPEEAVAVADDWSDVDLEPAVAAPVVEDAFAGTEDFSFAEEEPVAGTVEDFSFAEEQPMVADVFSSGEEVSLAEPDFDAFEMDEDEIMPLGDDDILGAEDLEPIMPEQTLAAWSRDEAAVEDGLVEPLEEEPAVEAEPAFVAHVEPAVVEEPPVFFDDEPVEEVSPVFEEPVAKHLSAEEPRPPAVSTTMADVETQVSALSEKDVEKIIEKIVTQVVEKLAGSILERVAWEVVPDLAENLIREEIRKIKDAAA
jgi:CheY-like chemotaxis protein